MNPVNEVSPADLKARLENGDDIFVVDMRTPGEYQSGHIPGAVNIFAQELVERAAEVPKDKPVVFQCWHGHTSIDAGAFFIQQGWEAEKIASLSGGIAGWAETNGTQSLER